MNSEQIPAIQVEGLTKRYRNGRGAFDVSFTLKQGDSFGLLGANGAGKTTVMKMLCGLIRPTSGQAAILGHDVETSRAAALGRVGTLIESPAFYGYLSGIENLRLAARYYPNGNMNEVRLLSILESVDMLQYKNEKAARYSLGMKQRLGLALAMLGNPLLYILDEPSNGLDIEGRVDIRNIITGLASRGDATFIICSHLAEEIQKTCNRVGIMAEGRLLTVTSMNEILSQYDSLESFCLESIRRREVV